MSCYNTWRVQRPSSSLFKQSYSPTGRMCHQLNLGWHHYIKLRSCVHATNDELLVGGNSRCNRIIVNIIAILVHTGCEASHGSKNGQVAHLSIHISTRSRSTFLLNVGHCFFLADWNRYHLKWRKRFEKSKHSTECYTYIKDTLLEALQLTTLTNLRPWSK